MKVSEGERAKVDEAEPGPVDVEPQLESNRPIGVSEAPRNLSRVQFNH